jgi:hypothetical protein
MVLWFLVSCFTSICCSSPIGWFLTCRVGIKKGQKTEYSHARSECDWWEKRLLFEPRIELGTFSVLD